MLPLKIHFIGCGRVGKTLAKLIKINQVGVISGIVNTSYESALQAIQFIGEGHAYHALSELPEADIYFITTPDDKIHFICESLLENNQIKKNSILVHCSGSLSSDVLSIFKNKGCSIASAHPIKSISDPESAINDFKNTHWALEGDLMATQSLSDLLKKIGGIIFYIDKKNKSLYHAACVIANNYLITLHHHAVECYKSSGVQEIHAYQIASELMQNALKNLNQSQHREALTGPLQRGDIQTIKNHITSLESHPMTKQLYLSLGMATLPLVEKIK